MIDVTNIVLTGFINQYSHNSGAHNSGAPSCMDIWYIMGYEPNNNLYALISIVVGLSRSLYHYGSKACWHRYPKIAG